MSVSIGLASIVMLGIFAQWLAWKVRFPSIVLLLLFGLISGPLTGLLNPDYLFGHMLLPVVSISVAIILFEGGLGLRFSELPQVGGVVRNLVTIGTVVTWLLGTGLAILILDMKLSLAFLLGAILVVTGPTVIGPLIRQMRPTSQIGSILKWEGITIDPIGAMLSVLVFEAILAGGFQAALASTALGMFQTVLVGSLAGAIGAFILVLMLKYYWLPDFLESPITLMLVVVVFVLSNVFQAESGLLAATLMGVILANQKSVNVKRIMEFKENLRVLLISSLFIILAARLQRSDLAAIDFGYVIFLVMLIIIVRPLAVLASTFKTDLAWKERLLLAWLAPRGIVAAAVASVFALDLTHRGYTGADELIPITFFVIVGTASIYGITTPILARKLKISMPNPQGVLIVGAHDWARAIAVALQEEGFRVLIVDTNYANVAAARMDGITALECDVLADEGVDDVNLEGIGRLLALTPNDEVNSLAAIHFSRIFDSASVYQLPRRKDRRSESKDERSGYLSGRSLFDETAHFELIEALFRRGAQIKKTTLTKEFDFADFKAHYNDSVLPLFMVSPNKELNIVPADKPFVPKPNYTLISFVPPQE